MKMGYARVSTEDQNLQLQIDALEAAGCDLIFKEKKSGRKESRPELDRMLGQLRSGDTVVVWKLDRLGRSMKQLVDLITDWHEKEIKFLSLTESLNLDGKPMSNAIFHFLAAITQMESDLGRERTMAGIEAARRQGRIGGRPKGLSAKSKEKAKVAASLYKQGSMSITSICSHLEVARTTFYKYLQHEGVQYTERSSKKPSKGGQKATKKKNA